MTARQRRPRILFVTHQASRTGAPLVVLYLMRWLREHTDYEFDTIALRGGPLEPEFAKLGRLVVLEPAQRSKRSMIERGLIHIGLRRVVEPVRVVRLRLRFLRLPRYDIVYLNGAVSFPLIRDLPRRCKRRVIGHLHELEVGMTVSLPHGAHWGEILRHFDRVIAASDAVEDYVLDCAMMLPHLITRHYEFIDPPPATEPESVELLRHQLGIPSDALVVGAMGMFEWRKGPDLFVQLAAELRRRRPGQPLYFVWVGASGDEANYWLVEHDIKHAGVEAVLRLVPPVDDVERYFALFDVFVLTSREDPFPLVCLEAAACELPVVSFDNGGMREFLTGGRGFLVPFVDVDAMADTVERLIDDPQLRADTGRVASAAVRSDYVVDSIAPAIRDEIARLLT